MELVMKDKKDCKDCKFYRNIDGFRFKCMWNYKTYTTPTGCFGFVKKVETANDIRKGL